LASDTCAVRALESFSQAQGLPLQGGIDLIFTYDQE